MKYIKWYNIGVWVLEIFILYKSYFETGMWTTILLGVILIGVESDGLCIKIQNDINKINNEIFRSFTGENKKQNEMEG